MHVKYFNQFRFSSYSFKMGCSSSSIAPETLYSPLPVSQCAVSFSFLQRFIKQVDPDWSTQDVVTKLIIPYTKKKKCRYTDMLPAKDVNKPAYFVSHRWGDKFVELIDALKKHRSATLPDEYYWIDIFAITQHKGENQAGDLDQLGEAVNSATKGTLLQLGDKGEAVTRVWCLYEIHKTIVLNKELKVLMPKLLYKWHFQPILGMINVANAQATIPKDKEGILAEIKKTIGIQQMNEKLLSSIVHSCGLKQEDADYYADRQKDFLNKSNEESMCITANLPIDNIVIPISTKQLTFGDDFNQPVDKLVLPASLTQLTFGLILISLLIN